jgi:hypothetical protein
MEAAEEAAVMVLLSNTEAEGKNLPRAAGFGYPEPYTRDLMIAGLGILANGNQTLIDGIQRTLEILAKNQSPLGHIPSLADDPYDRGETDTTPLFLIGLAAFRTVTGENKFLEEAAERALTWLQYQSPADRVITAQQPTSDWRDEQWVLGYGLYVNTLVYAALKLWGQEERAAQLKVEMNRPVITRGSIDPKEQEGLALEGKPYYALWSYKILFSERFDLLGNSLAILTGIADRSRAESIVHWVEESCLQMREKGILSVNLPPNLFPFILNGEPDWYERYEKYNRPGEYHNGGVWPFVAGFYIAALTALGKTHLAREKLEALTEAVTLSTRPELEFGFNEWIRAQDGEPKGVDWQTWSAAMYLYAVDSVKQDRTTVFDRIRGDAW